MKQTRKKNHYLAAAMARSGKTARTISEEAGIHWNTISRLMNLKDNPRSATALAIAKSLNTTVEDLGWMFDDDGDCHYLGD